MNEGQETKAGAWRAEINQGGFVGIWDGRNDLVAAFPHGGVSIDATRTRGEALEVAELMAASKRMLALLQTIHDDCVNAQGEMPDAVRDELDAIIMLHGTP